MTTEKEPADEAEESGMKVKCLSCGSPQEGFFCHDCHTVLPIGGESDYFTLFELERRPLLDEERLRETFLRLNQLVHPDRYFNATDEIQEVSLDRSSLVNQAYQTLKDPRERLKYLLMLETGEEPRETSRASMEIMGFYMEAAEVCQEADQWVKARESGSPRPEREAEVLRSRLMRDRDQAAALWRESLKEIEAVDREWTGGDRKLVLDRIRLLCNDLSYIAKLRMLIDQQILGLS
ncbi:MAG: Fe-S protein assembly co-chaperone HscB [Nitrospirae bacterium]|nr:Fe-S protein assembly co-chaperone HscB [Nitrospirota bacterium]